MPLENWPGKLLPPLAKPLPAMLLVACGQPEAPRITCQGELSYPTAGTGDIRRTARIIIRNGRFVREP